MHCLSMSHEKDARRIWVKFSGEAPNKFKSKGFLASSVSKKISLLSTLHWLMMYL